MLIVIIADIRVWTRRDGVERWGRKRGKERDALRAQHSTLLTIVPARPDAYLWH
jgi:hypothetical protein